MSAQIAADLRAAAEVLRRDGWTQDDVGSCEGPKCAAGAINYIATGGASVDIESEDPDDEYRAEDAMRALGKALDTTPYHVTGWNDAPGRTADEVIAALEAAAAAAEAQS